MVRFECFVLHYRFALAVIALLTTLNAHVPRAPALAGAAA
jgi:hypothetical protein